MNKRIGLLFLMFVFSFWNTVSKASNPAVKTDDKLLITSKEFFIQDLDQEIEFGKPYNIIQFAPAEKLSSEVRFNLDESIFNTKVANGINIDITGLPIVPLGYTYAFYKSKEEADREINVISSITYELSRDSGGQVLWLRLDPAFEGGEIHIDSFELIIDDSSPSELEDYIVDVSDIYQCSEPAKQTTFVLTQQANQLYYGQPVDVFTVENGVKIPVAASGTALVPSYSVTTSERTQIQMSVTASIGGVTQTVDRSFFLNPIYVNISSSDIQNYAVQSHVDEQNLRWGTFDLSSVNSELLEDPQTQKFHEFTFFKVRPSAQSKPIEDINNFPAADGTIIYVRIVDRLSGNGSACVAIKQVTLKVLDLPVIPPLEDFSKCDSTIEQIAFLLSNQDEFVADGRTIIAQEDINEDTDLDGLFTIGYYSSKEDADQDINRIIGDEYVVKANESREIWVRLTKLSDGSYNTAHFYASLTGVTLSIRSNHKNVYCRDIVTGMQSTDVNLNNINHFFLPIETTEQELEVVYFRSQADAQAANFESLALSNSEVSNYAVPIDGQYHRVWARVKLRGEGFHCYSEIGFIDIGVNQRPKVTIDQANVNSIPLCAPTDNSMTTSFASLSVTLDPNEKIEDYIISWDLLVPIIESPGFERVISIPEWNNLLSVEVSEPGKYRVTVRYKNQQFPALSSCVVSKSWNIYQSNVKVLNADSTGMVNSLDIDEYGRALVELGIEGINGTANNIEFAIDNGPFTTNNRFYDVTIGEHIAYARTAGYCVSTVKFSVFGFPKYFTPNGDGYNDTWNIPGLQGHPEARINIFDRNGRLIKQISPLGQGWDGTFNGKQMPSTDYWFTLEFTTDFVGNPELDAKRVTYKGHFSLKR